MRPRPILIWLVATVAATTIAWATVAQVVARTVQPLPAGIAPDAAAPARPAGPVTGAGPTGVGDATDGETSTPPPTTRAAAPAEDEIPEGRDRPNTRSYQLTGGDVTISFSARAVEVVSVTPRPGYTVEPIDRHGDRDVEVELRSDHRRSRLRAWWDDGPQHRIDEDD